MIKGPLISIIMPIYNTPVQILERSIESVRTQSYENIEMIMVDDGSRKEIADFCDCYRGADGRVKVLHKENGGPSTARNVGVAVSQGEYILFADSDDQCDPFLVEKLYACMLETRADMCLCAMQIRGKKGQRDVELMGNRSVASLEEFLFEGYIDIYALNYVYSMCAKLFRGDVIRGNAILCDEALKNCEDGLFIMQYCRHVKNIGLVREPLYYRFYHDAPDHEQISDGMIRDFFEFHIRFYEGLWALTTDGLDEARKRELDQCFFNRLLSHLVRASAYAEYFPIPVFKKKLCVVLENKTVGRACALYRRPRKKDSRLIPFFVRIKWAGPLYALLRRRGLRFMRTTGKATNVKTMYREQRSEANAS